MQDVVVTGIGMVTPLGVGAKASFEAWQTGVAAKRSRLSELAGTPLAEAEVAVLPSFEADERLGQRRLLKYMSWAAELGCVAAHEAAQEARLGARFAPERIGLYAGTGLATADVNEVRPMIEASIDETGRFSCQLFGKEGLPKTNPLLSFKILANMPPCFVSILERIRGPNLIFTPWEGQTAAAVLEGWRAVAEAEVDSALVGAADNPAHPASYVYLRQSRRLSADEFPAAGAAYLALESAQRARRDGQPVYARISQIQCLPSDGPANDPLSRRLGRSFAASPAILLALAALEQRGYLDMTGSDGRTFAAELEYPA